MTFRMRKKVRKRKKYFQRKIDVPGIQKTAKNLSPLATYFGRLVVIKNLRDLEYLDIE